MDFGAFTIVTSSARYMMLILVTSAVAMVTIVSAAPTDNKATVDISNPCHPFQSPVMLGSLLRGMTLPPVAPASPEPRELHFDRIRRSATDVKGLVMTLKTKFAADRFSDSSLMVKLEGGELILDGMPRVSLHLEDTTDIHDARRIHDTFQNVSTSALFIIQARQGEITYEHSVYERHYLDIERGLYSILCSLHSYLASQSLKVDEEVVRAAIHRTDFLDPNELSYRRIRDFIILRDLDRLLFAISASFQNLIDISILDEGTDVSILNL